MRIVQSAGSGRWAPRLASLVLFALLCAIVAYWSMRLLEPPVRIAPAGSLAGRDLSAGLPQAATLFGRAGAGDGAVARAVASNFKLLGLIADPDRGAAILSVDGRPAEAFGVGAKIDDTHTLKSVDRSGAVISHGAEEIRLDAPETASLDILTSGPAPGGGTPPGAVAPPARPLPPSGAAAGRVTPAVPPKPEMIHPPREAGERR